LLADLPTVAEAGVPGYEVVSWFGMLAPVATPRPIVEKLRAEIVKNLQMPDVRERCAAVGLEIVGSTPAELSAFVRQDMAKWAKVFKDANIPRIE
jgi:tripartite-type tricarboxylate transporter receptor subunit TctC